jgi:hypothetical protein
MNTKDDSILFGAKRAGITWLFKFDCAARLKRARAGAKRLGMSLAELLCRAKISTDLPDLPEPRKFTDEDQKSSTLKIQITECDSFTRRCLERQAKINGCESVEEYITDSAFMWLVTDEDNAILDPQTGDAVLTSLDLGTYTGCKVDKNATTQPPSNFTRKRVPRGTIVEQCA